MASAANQGSYGYPGWGPGAGGWNRPADRPAGPWQFDQDRSPSMGDPDLQRSYFWPTHYLNGPMGIGLMVLGFIFFWPVGLAVLLYMLGSGRMSCRSRRRRDGFSNDSFSGPSGWAGPWNAWRNWACGSGAPSGRSSGNHAFDEYRAETIRRLEEEQKEFGAFLERLRFARDKAEFDQFMSERRNRPNPPTNGNDSGEQPAA